MSTPKIAALLGVAAMLGVIGSVLLGKLLWADYVLCGICLPRACGCHHDLACARRNGGISSDPPREIVRSDATRHRIRQMSARVARGWWAICRSPARAAVPRLQGATRFIHDEIYSSVGSSLPKRQKAASGNAVH